MFPPNQGSSLNQDSSLNRKPRENFYISGYKDPNAISQDVLDRGRTLISVVNVLDLDDETGTRSSP